MKTVIFQWPMRGLVAALVMLGAMLVGAEARAEYTFCNKSSYALSAALGFHEGEALLTRGWWRLRPGECRRVLSDDVDVGRYYVYAEAIPGHGGPLRTWSGETPLCVQNDSLFTLREQSVCQNDPQRQRDFYPVEVTAEDEGSFTTDFTDESNFTSYKAQVAGIQRLLADVGYDIGDIDGAFGAATKTALRDYRRSRGIGQNAVIDEAVIDALITQANEQDARLGFFFCNETMLPVWAAFAQPTDDQEGYRSSGWWRLESSACAKVRRGTLGEEPYYVYGIMQAEDQELPLAGGDTPFCISSVQFDAESDIACEASGFDTAVFRRIDTGGEPAWTFEFTPEQFNPDLAATP
ncbi:MAG: DUF1036 domain-containing protein [Pseudomonadota bacterium]